MAHNQLRDIVTIVQDNLDSDGNLSIRCQLLAANVTSMFRTNSVLIEFTVAKRDPLLERWRIAIRKRYGTCKRPRQRHFWFKPRHRPISLLNVGSSRLEIGWKSKKINEIAKKVKTKIKSKTQIFIDRKIGSL